MGILARPKVRTSVLYGILVGIVAPSAVISLWASASLRPIADDYCIAAVAARGPLSSVVHWFTMWSGDLVVWGGHTIWVGLPLAFLPWTISSALPFMISSLMVAITVAVSIHTFRFTGSTKTRAKVSMPFFISVLVSLSAWWTFWWLTGTVREEGDSRALAEATLHWQSLNVGYVVPVAALVLACSLMWSVRRNRLRLLLLFIAGVFAGFSGPVIASTLAFGAFGTTAALWLRERAVPRATVTAISSLVLGASLAAVVSFTSPGTTNRRSKMDGLNYRDTLSGSAEFDFVSPSFLSQWWEGISSPGSVYAALLFVLMGIVMGLTGYRLPPHRLAWLGVGLTALSLLMSLMSRISELFVYQAYWHQTSFLTLMFIGISLIGTGLGLWIARASLNVSVFVVIGAPIVLLPLSFSGAFALEQSAQSRLLQWNIGPAPTARIGDLEDGSGWRKCWIALIELKDDPGRSIGPNGVEPPIPY